MESVILTNNLKKDWNWIYLTAIYLESSINEIKFSCLIWKLRHIKRCNGRLSISHYPCKTDSFPRHCAKILLFWETICTAIYPEFISIQTGWLVCIQWRWTICFVVCWQTKNNTALKIYTDETFGFIFGCFSLLSFISLKLTIRDFAVISELVSKA